MLKGLWKDIYGGVCSINFFSDNGIKLTSITGLKVNNSLITDEYIYKIQKCVEVTFQFVEENGFTIRKTIRMSFQEFSDRVNKLVEYENEGYAIIELDSLDVHDIPSLSIENELNYAIGESIAVVGFHMGQENLSIKSGVISSFFQEQNTKRFIQFDASIKKGNSGSPLVCLSTGKVIGVVGHRLSGVSKTYEAFKKIIDDNLQVLKKSEGKFNILDIDPIQVMIVNQQQLKQISKEFYQSSILSFGYAHQVNSISSYLSGNDSDSVNHKIGKEIKA